MTVDEAARRALLLLARSAVEVAVGVAGELRVVEAGILRERRGAFVTLRKWGRLRGCIGRIEPDSPLEMMLPAVARLAALRDPRFPPVVAGELRDVRFEVSLLTAPAPLPDPSALVVGRDGLIVSSGTRRGLLLPQVPIEHGWSAEEFLARACEKADLPADAWRDRDVRLLSFQADVFAEAD
jgi:AmmeMemoRadiSam system protein A